MTQEGGWDGGGMGRGIRFRINGQISALYPPQLSISERSFCEKYVRLPEVDYLCLDAIDVPVLCLGARK